MTFFNFDPAGVSVKNPQGRFLGLGNEVMIDSHGQAFAILNHGEEDLYGPGGVCTPVSIAAWRISETKSGKKEIVLKADTEYMDFAPYLDPTKVNTPHYEANIDRYFGVQPSWLQEGEAQRK